MDNATNILRNVPSVDLRLIFQSSATYLSVIGLLLNAFLIYLIFFKTSKKVCDYKIILIQNCFVDILFNVVNEIGKGQTDYKNGAFYWIGSDLLKEIPFPYNSLIAVFWVFSLFYCVTSIPVQFIYRYFIIVYGKTISIFQYLILIIIAIFGALSFAIFFGWVVWPEKELLDAKALLLENDIFYFRGLPMFMVAEIQRWPLRLCFAFGYFLVIISYGITIFTSWKVWKKLKNQELVFSPQTRRMHNQMTKTMIMQATVPLFFVLIPIGCAITSAFALINVPGLGMIVNLMCCWIPVANPLVTIISVKTYRMVVISYYRKCLRKAQLRSSVIPAVGTSTVADMPISAYNAQRSLNPL